MNATTGSGVRPAQMLKAFEESEYEVDVVSGYGAERKSKINEIKRKIRKENIYLYTPFQILAFLDFVKNKVLKQDYFIEIYIGNFQYTGVQPRNGFLMCLFRFLNIIYININNSWTFYMFHLKSLWNM